MTEITEAPKPRKLIEEGLDVNDVWQKFYAWCNEVEKPFGIRSLYSSHVSTKSGTDELFHIAPKVDTSGRDIKRKYKLLIIGTEGVLTYGKRVLLRSRDLDALAEAVAADAKLLDEKYNARNMRMAKNEGDVGKILMEMIRERAITLGLKVEMGYDCACEMPKMSHKDNTIEVSGIVRVDGNIVTVLLRGSDRRVNHKFSIADPSFSPERFTDLLFEKLRKTQQVIIGMIDEMERILKDDL